MIEVKNISKRYRNTVLDDISFTAEKGQCIGIIGANGCGKTTLLSIMAGVNKAQSGKIYYNNELADRKSVFKKYIAYVPQENPLIDELTTKDNLLLWLGSNRKIKDGFENGVLKDLGIDEFLNKQVNELSGGMKKKIKHRYFTFKQCTYNAIRRARFSLRYLWQTGSKFLYFKLCKKWWNCSNEYPR